MIPKIEHVSRNHSSRSQRFAFEVGIEDDVLMLACENQSLTDEWIKAFSNLDVNSNHLPPDLSLDVSENLNSAGRERTRSCYHSGKYF